MSARTTASHIVEVWREHVREVRQGEIARARGSILQVDKNIDGELRKQIESFMNAGVRMLKHGMQNVAGALQVNVGFLFQKEPSFARAVAVLNKTDPQLAEYL